MMTPEQNTSESENKNTASQPETTGHQADVDTQASTEIPQEKVLSEIDREDSQPMGHEGTGMEADDHSYNNADDNSSAETSEDNLSAGDTQVSTEIPEENIPSETDRGSEAGNGSAQTEDHRSVNELLAEMEKLVTSEHGGAESKKFNELKNSINTKIEHENSAKSEESTEHPAVQEVLALSTLFKEKSDAYHSNQDAENAKNLEHRKEIIEKMKTLYTNTEPGTNLFRAIREIKEMWSQAGKVAKNDFKLLNNDYFHHLNQFYAMLDMNKEYLEQEYTHNLEKRQHIIERAKELENETSAQKALNELQYLHKLWKEEAEPVAEEHREKTWEEFKEISNRIHDRKAELNASQEAEQNANLEVKNKIIEQIKGFAAPAATITHGYWQQAIREVEQLREQFLKTGSVPRKISNQNWNDFKQTLRAFNTAKNDFYKNLKGDQLSNLEQKQQIIQTAKDNMMSEDWETAVPLFKKLQEQWKTIGHVPRNQANKVWDEFREASNTFFDNYRKKSGGTTDNWKENYKNKMALIEDLKTVNDEDGSLEKIEEIRKKWNEIGKVPKDKMSANTEFNALLREKLKFNNAPMTAKEQAQSDMQNTDRARKVKNQVAELESEISTLENNLGFFSNPNRENPLLKDTFAKIDEKKAHLEQLKANLHTIIKGE